MWSNRLLLSLSMEARSLRTCVSALCAVNAAQIFLTEFRVSEE